MYFLIIYLIFQFARSLQQISNKNVQETTMERLKC